MKYVIEIQDDGIPCECWALIWPADGSDDGMRIGTKDYAHKSSAMRAAKDIAKKLGLKIVNSEEK